MLAAGAAGFALYAVLVNLGETRVSAGMTSFVVNTVPVFTAILAMAFLGERIRGRGWVGLAVSMSGATLLAFSTTSRIEVEPAVVVLLAAAIVQAAYFILQKPLAVRYGAASVTSWAVWSGTACLLPFLPGAMRSIPSAPVAATLSVVYLGVMATVAGYAAWAFATARLPVGRATLALYFVPVVATLLGWLLLGERPTLLATLGGLVVIGGVALANHRPR